MWGWAGFVMLTLTDIATNPDQLVRDIILRNGRTVRYRPLVPDDVAELGRFLESLSALTRTRWNLSSYDRAAAEALCEAIGRYDKLRLVVDDPAHPEEGLLALFEFSFGIPPGDHKRYAEYGLSLDERWDCRFGPCVRDDYQSTGLASALMAPTLDIARGFAKKRIFLWGGVWADNTPALAYYARHGFQEVGRFYNMTDQCGIDMIRSLD
jgi:GNAT superfamily N-acetyltransferase